MRRSYAITLVWLAASVISQLISGCGSDSADTPSTNPTATARLTIPPGFSSQRVHVKFREGTDVDSPLEALPSDLKTAVKKSTKLFTLPKQKLDDLKTRGRSRSGKNLPDLNLWIELTLQSDTDVTVFLNELQRLPSVEIAEPAPLPQHPPAVTPDLSGNQGYLDVAPPGIDANYSVTLPGGNGSGVKLYDVEYSWHQTHEDLTKAHGISLLLSPGDSAADPFNDDNHGTAVLGEMVADKDTKGVTGISWGATIGLAPANTVNRGYNPANAILLAAADGSAGDIILLEQQFPVCGLPDFGPIESLSSVFQAIQTAVAQGLVVIEAAGNGGVNLDQSACFGQFDRTVQDSGATIVGAGFPPVAGLDRQRIGFSTFGTRVDLQGWGINVTTAGYGDLYRNIDAPSNPDFFYAGAFSGTSSASAIIAGAAANLQGIALTESETPLTPLQIRTLLVQTGSPQLGNTAEHTGPRPDLRQAIAQLKTIPIDVALDIEPGLFPNSINPRNKGVIPVAILTTEIFNATKVSANTVRFGATGTEAAPITSALQDVDGDGDLDLILHFETVKTAIQCGKTTAYLTGQIFDGRAIEGFDSIVTVGCRK